MYNESDLQVSLIVKFRLEKFKERNIHRNVFGRRYTSDASSLEKSNSEVLAMKH